jgi:hypothetical protein
MGAGDFLVCMSERAGGIREQLAQHAGALGVLSGVGG